MTIDSLHCWWCESESKVKYCRLIVAGVCEVCCEIQRKQSNKPSCKTCPHYPDEE